MSIAHGQYKLRVGAGQGLQFVSMVWTDSQITNGKQRPTKGHRHFLRTNESQIFVGAKGKGLPKSMLKENEFQK
jgi:hypothetical protein